MLVFAAGVAALALIPFILSAWFVAAVILTAVKFLGATVTAWALIAFCSGGIAVCLGWELFLDWKERKRPE